MFDHPFTKIFVPIFKGNFLYVILCLLSLAMSLSTTEKKLGLSPSLLPDKGRSLFSRLNNLSSLSTSSYEKYLNSLLNFLALSWTPSSSSAPLSMWGAQTLTQKYRCVSPRQRREEGSSLFISR